MNTSKRRVKKAHAQTTEPTEPLAPSEFQWIDTDLIDDPLFPARDSFDDDKLHELIESIRVLGIIEPLLVHPEGQRFRVDAGHRRIVCARALHLPKVPCRVYANTAGLGEALKHHENKFREDLNAAEQARHFMQLLEGTCGGDVDRLCELVQERREYVETRLLLLQGDPRVFQSLLESAISIGVARELNQIKDSARRMMYLESAVQGGASVRMVREWRVRGNAMDEIDPRALELPAHTEGLVSGPSVTTGVECSICGTNEDMHEMEIIYVHRSCARAHDRLTRTGNNQTVGGTAQ